MNDQSAVIAVAEEHSGLIRWKTDAWQNPHMVKWYSGRMVNRDATSHLKNVVEIDTIKHFVRGHDVIDIGVGTGRAALPLVADGYRLTGVDSSQAMLDETRRLADGAPIRLQVGDVVSVPCDDHTFDSAVSLNVLVHFPNWREALLEWKRVVRPGGRLIFDIHSLDHAVHAYGADQTRWPEALRRSERGDDFVNYMSRVSIEQLVSFADEAGFRIVSTVPYGAFFGGGNVNWLLHSDLESKNRWKRVLSWFARDDALLELGVFLEEKLVSWLTPKYTGRMFVVLENEADPAANARFKADIAARDAAIAEGDLAKLLPWLPLTLEQYAKELGRLLQPLRSRHFFFLLYRALLARVPGFDFRGVIPGDVLDQFRLWMENDRIDRETTEIARGWSAAAAFKFKDGVDVTVGTEYSLIKALLEKHFGVFGGGRQ